ncbi:hypothetical protein CYANOKiyG1_03330 [Okeania sp. KiyG1]|nr:hypothetical protein CYANOKiyG1_03330 [Okeania sp. KiyG1]
MLFPTAGYLEIAIAAARNIFTSSQILLTDVVVSGNLILLETEIKEIQTVVTQLEENTYKLKIFTTEAEEKYTQPEWTLYAEVNIHLVDSITHTEETIDIEKYQRDCTKAIDIKQHYQKFQEVGINYGNSFQGIKQLWKGQGKALAEIYLPNETAQATDYHIHPALLDVAFQVINHAIPKTEIDKIYLPVSIEKFKLYSHIETKIWVVAETLEDSLTGNIKLLDEGGNVLGEIYQLKLMATTASAILSTLKQKKGNYFNEIDWQQKPQTTTQSKNEQLLEHLQTVSLEQRENILIAHIQNETARVLGIINSQVIDVEKPLNKMGLDSIMALELRNRVQNELDVDIPITKFMQGITIADLSIELERQIAQSDERKLNLEPENNVKDSKWIEVEL